MVITLSGDSSFLLQKRLVQLTETFKKEHGELALERLDAAEIEPAAVREAVQSLPFLAVRKMVLLREPSANRALAEDIEQIISSTADSTELIIYEPLPDKRTAYYKTLKAKTEFEEYRQLDQSELAKWLVEEAKKINAVLTYADAVYLIERLGQDQTMLFSELQKLALYDSEIDRQAINLLTEKNPQTKIFDLLAAAFSGNKKMALDLYGEQRSQRVEPQNILALITWQLNLIALAKFGEGKSSVQIARDAKVSPYPLQKAQQLAAKLSQESLQQMVNRAMTIDYKSKQTSLDLDEALKDYIVTL
jgi:DNA polymerase III subunit delta